MNGLKHGPVAIDDMIGCLLETKEGFGEKKAAIVHECLQASGKYGMGALPVKYKAGLAWCMVRYKMSYEKGVELFGKYVGNWGGETVTWRFEGWKDGKKIAEAIKSPSSSLHMEAKASHTELHEGDTYDMAAIRFMIKDENGNIAPYAQLPVKIETEGCIETVGPDMVSAEGGMAGTYIRTTGKTGTGAVTLTASGLEPVRIEFTVGED